MVTRRRSFGPDLRWRLLLRMRRRCLIAGFGSFSGITDNPSGRILPQLHQRLAARFSAPRVVQIEAVWLPVRPGVLDTIPVEAFDTVILLGVDGKSDRIRIEVTAQNQFKDRPKGEMRPIDIALPPLCERRVRPLPENLARGGVLRGLEFGPGLPGTAGDYVCNDSLFRALGRNPASYFIHLPNRPSVQDERLILAITDLIEEIITSLEFTRKAPSGRRY